MISNCERAGCAGLVRFYESEELQFNSPIPPIFWWSCRNCSYLAPQNSIDFPVVQSQIGQQALLLFGAILTMPNLTIVFPEVNVTVNSDINYYQYVGGTYGIFYQVWMGLWSLFNTVCAAVFIYAQLKKRRAEFPLLAVVALTLECFANAMRFTICVVDPLVVWGIYWPISVLQIWSSFFFSWSLIATFLIAFFWFKLSFHFGRKLDTTSPAVIVPVLFVSILILAVEYVPLCILIFSPIYVGNTLLGRVIAQSLCYWIISAFFYRFRNSRADSDASRHAPARQGSAAEEHGQLHHCRRVSADGVWLLHLRFHRSDCAAHQHVVRPRDGAVGVPAHD
jgi:hypothetical protein